MPTRQKYKLSIASDHAGFELKEFLKQNMLFAGHDVYDHGCFSKDVSVDYPDYGHMVAEKVASESANFGILICGSGIGISIAANRNKHARAALCHSIETAELARKHNDANIICIGARIVSREHALEMVNAFLATKFEGGRHEKRVKKLCK